MFSSPHGDFSFSIKYYDDTLNWNEFSSPHGDFSFSMEIMHTYHDLTPVFVPSRGFLFFYAKPRNEEKPNECFRPLTGISLFLFKVITPPVLGHGSFRPLTGISLFL